jgi:hypothetical protein
MRTRDKMCRYTYITEHSPTCKTPYLVRLPGIDSVMMDKKHPTETKDAFGYGKTEIQAFKAALKMQTEQRIKFLEYIRKPRSKPANLTS